MQQTQQVTSPQKQSAAGQRNGANPNSPDGRADNYSNSDQIEMRLSDQLKHAEQDFAKFTANDTLIKRKDTVEVVVDILNRIKQCADDINKMTQDMRERLYYLTYNCTIQIFKICHQMREANYSKEATQFLAFNILCLDNNLILTTAKYLDWRVMNYVELGRCYADQMAYKAAIRVISYGIQKVLYLKQIEDQDPPVPDGTKETLVEALRVLRTQELKYQLQAGVLTADAWKKKIEETFNQNKYHRSLAIVECLSTNDPASCRLIQRNAKNLQSKTQALKLSIDLVKADVLLLKQALIQIHEKKKRDMEKKEQLMNREADLNVDELLEKYKALDSEMIKEKDWKFASYNVPIEVHVEMLKLCYESKLWQEFDLLLDPALVRLKFRRYEVPYLATVDVLMSASKIANIPNGFEKIPKDINSANLRIELKRLRAQAKMLGPSAGGDKKEEEKKKEDAKKAPAQLPAGQKPGAKPGAKPDPKAAQQQQQEIPKDEEDENQIQASEAELEKIKHIYVNLLLQRTKNSQNAICGVDVVLADENVGPDLPENHYAVAVPIRQHTGVYEKTKLIPYIVFRRTANALIDEEDSLSVVTDITIIMGQDPHIRAPLGYHKIPIDLRQTPKDLERVPNLDYVYLCYKTDKQLALSERDLLVFRRLADLEKSYIEKGTPDYKALEEGRLFMSVQYNLEMLVDLSRTIKESLLGPLGDYYLEQRQDILFDISCMLWSKYLLPVLQRVDVYTEMRHQREYPMEFVEQMDEYVISLKNYFSEAFNVMQRILTRMPFVEDMIMYCKFSIYLATLQEEIGEFRNSVQTLRSALGKIVEFREERLKQCLDSKENVRTSMSITVDNKKIGELEHKINLVYETWEQMILRKERDRERREKEYPGLDEDEGDEEQLEVQECIDELKNKDLFERSINIEEWRKTMREKNKVQGAKYFNEQEQIIHSLHVDLLVNLYRSEIKLGREMGVVKNQTNKLLISQGLDLSKNAPGNITKNLSASMSQKMNQTKNKTLSKSKNDLQNLKQTLQEAGKLPPPKPQIQSYEKILEKENNQNPYQNALLHMCLAVAKSNIVEQKSLLLEAVECLKKAKTSEDGLSQLALENAIYLKAAQHYHEYYEKSADQVHPFNLMAKQQYIKKTNTPSKPIMICRTSTSITMKLPFYRPVTEYKSWRNIDKMALFGKPSGSGVGVSLNNTEYEGTGEKRHPGAVVRVTELIPNERYVFASGGYTQDGICVNGIGETSSDIITLLPLSLHQLSGYLAEISFKLGHYTIAKQVAENLCAQFIEKNEFKYQMLDTRINPILAFKLNHEYLQLLSPIEAKQLSEAFLILAKVSKIVKSDTQKRADQSELKVEKQKIDMKICNYLLIALDIASGINQFVLIKRIVSEVYNHLIPYFSMNLRPQLLFQILFKCHESLRQVPSELLDSNMRRIISCISYQILRLDLENQEEESFKRIMISELPLNTRKWRKYQQHVMRRPQLTEELKVKKEEQEKRIKLGEIIPESELIRDPEPYEEKVVKFEEFESEGQSLEEFLLQLIDYQDVIKAKTERWKLAINRFQKQATNGNDVVEKAKEQIIQVVEFWEGIKLNNPLVQIQQIIQAYDAGNQHARYLEFCCKCIRRAMDLSLGTFQELEDILNLKIKIPDDLIGSIENKSAERLEYLDKDIVRKQRKRFNILEEKVNQIQETNNVSAGSKAFNMKQLDELMQGNIFEDEDDYWGIVQYDNEEEEKANTYSYLWISEKLYLQGINAFMTLASQHAQRSLIQAGNQQVVYNDILQLDFNKFKQALDEHNQKTRYLKEQFEEEHKSDNEHFQLKIEERVKKIGNFVKVMARAAEYARNARAWLQLENIIRYTWNVLNYDLTSPLELKETDAWRYVVILSECSLYLVEYLKNGGQLRKSNNLEIDQVKNQKPTLYKDQGKTVAFKIEGEDDNPFGNDNLGHNESKQTIATSKSGAVGANGKGLKWFEKIQEFDISVHCSFITFGIQCLMGVKKWESLVDLSNRINTASENTYAQYLLPFIIYAQTTLYEDAAARTLSKRSDLQIRTQQFENWKATNKKKRSRQAMITGEIPQEEQEYLRDKAQFEKDIQRLEIIENVLRNDKEKSDQLLEFIKRDANSCEESLKQCRKLYFQFGIETQNLRVEELKKGQTHFEIRAKRKGHKVYTNMVIQNYKKCIELLRKRQEKFFLIQALHELGNLLYADGQLGEAEIQWNDCVDTIFQRLYVINSFREVFKSNSQLADTLGSKQCLIGGIVLTKLAKLCYEGRDQYRYNECLLMTAELYAAPAKLSFPHPQIPIEYANYRLREFLSDQLYSDKYIITPSELLHTLGVATQSLIDADLFEKALPLASLMEYIANDISKSKVLTVKARLLKAIALVEIGFINEAYQIYNKILSQKDLPKIGGRESEFTSKKDGKNFYFPSNQRYYNNFPPEHEKNAEAIQNLLKIIPQELMVQLRKYLSPYVLDLLHYLRSLFLVRLGESENVETPEKSADLRIQLLKQSEENLRNNVLKSVQLNEEIMYCKDRLEQLTIKEIDIPEQEIGDLKSRLQKCFEAQIVNDEDQKNFYSNKEEEMCYADRRSQYLSLLLRSRLLIGRIQAKQGFLLQSFYVLRQGLQNFKALAEGKHSKVETGLESEDKGTFKLPEIYGGSGLGLPPSDPKQAAAQQKQQQAAAQQKPAPGKPGPGGKGNAQQQQQDEEEQKRLEEERKKREVEEELKEKQRVEQAERRDHPHIYLWLKTKVEIVNILYHQKRFEDCADCIAVTKLECQALNDLYFIRQLMEVEFMMEVYRGEVDQALKTAEKIRKHAQAYSHNDGQYANFLGNLSEFMYNKDKRTESIEVVKEGRLIIWYKLRDFGLDLDPQNINFKNDVKVNQKRAKPNEEILAQFQTSVPQPGAKPGAAAGKAPAGGAKPGAAGAKGQPQVPEDLPVEEEKVEPSLDFTNKLVYQLVQADVQVNSSYQEPNIYLKFLESAVRFDARYGQYLTMLEKKHDLARKVLQDSEKLIKRTVHISPQLKFYIHFLLGKCTLQIFYDKVKEYQQKYETNPKYKEKLTKHIPYGSIALGQYLLNLPLFSDKLKKYFKDYLEWSKKSLKQAIDIAKSEPIVYEFDFSVVDTLREMAEVNFLIAEYRARSLEYKYAKYKELDITRKITRRLEAKKDGNLQNGNAIDDNLLEEELEKEIQASRDDWEEQKLNKEKLEIANHRRAAVHYLELSVALSKVQREFVDKQHLMGTVNLTDPSKIPREIASELFESFQVTKVNYAKVPDFEPKDKAAITSSELLAYLKALGKELEFMTFGEEKSRQSKLISKLHRYLKLNLASYVQKCSVEIKDPEEFKDASQLPPNIESYDPIGKTKLACKWLDFKGQKSSLLYVIGPIDDQLLSQLYPREKDADFNEYQQKLRDEERKDHQVVHFGKMDVDPLVLSALFQDVRDLVDKMKASEKLPANFNERDRRGYRVKFEQLLERFGNFFKAPVLTDDEINATTKTVDVIEEIKDIIPDLTVDNVEKLALILQKDTGCSLADAKYNTILRRFHRIRYVK